MVVPASSHLDNSRGNAILANLLRTALDGVLSFVEPGPFELAGFAGADKRTDEKLVGKRHAPLDFSLQGILELQSLLSTQLREGWVGRG